eukprot:scaffold81223_cov35-Tisochrysis_lutea.AAC.2
MLACARQAFRLARLVPTPQTRVRTSCLEEAGIAGPTSCEFADVEWTVMTWVVTRGNKRGENSRDTPAVVFLLWKSICRPSYGYVWHARANVEENNAYRLVRPSVDVAASRPLSRAEIGHRDL